MRTKVHVVLRGYSGRAHEEQDVYVTHENYTGLVRNVEACFPSGSDLIMMTENETATVITPSSYYQLEEGTGLVAVFHGTIARSLFEMLDHIDSRLNIILTNQF
jgi:hypothetical protein